MPFIELITNIDLPTDKKKEVALSLSAESAKILNKPPQAFGVNIRFSEVLSFAGNFDPCFMLRITSLNNLTPENNVRFSAGYAAWLKEVLGIEADRGYITFFDPTDPNIGFKGTTMAELRKKL